MRSLSLALVVLALAGCGHLRQSRAPQLAIEPSSACLDASDPNGLHVALSNPGAGPVTVSLVSASGPPYTLHPWAAEAVGSAGATDRWSVVLEDYARPAHELRIGPRDRAEVVVYTSSRPLPGYRGTVTLAVRDTSGHVFASQPMNVCAPGSVPNNSSKPTPLRGAA